MSTKIIRFQRQLIIILTVVLSFSACGKSDGDFDASGTFEATEIVVSAESVGQLLQFNITEGMNVIQNQPLGLIDSTQLYLKKQQLIAMQKAMLTRRPNIQKQVSTLEQQIRTAKSERIRTKNLVNANAANRKQLDDIDAQISVLETQLAASTSTYENADDGIINDSEAMEIQIRQVEDQLRKCVIVSPINGTVMLKFAEQGELAMVGKPLFKIADMQHMILRAYVTAEQLNNIKVGQKVKILTDTEQTIKLEGTVAWISSKSEFTPKTIQTKNERANLVYAMKIAVVNDGFLKIGMYGNVRFK